MASHQPRWLPAKNPEITGGDKNVEKLYTVISLEVVAPMENWRFPPSKRHNIKLLYDLKPPLLDIYPTEWKTRA